jgi:hypothetical protein
LSVDDILDRCGAPLDFPDELEELAFDEEDETVRQKNLEYCMNMAAGLGMKMSLS